MEEFLIQLVNALQDFMMLVDLIPLVLPVKPNVWHAMMLQHAPLVQQLQMEDNRMEIIYAHVKMDISKRTSKTVEPVTIVVKHVQFRLLVVHVTALRVSELVVLEDFVFVWIIIIIMGPIKYVSPATILAWPVLIPAHPNAWVAQSPLLELWHQALALATNTTLIRLMLRLVQNVIIHVPAVHFLLPIVLLATQQNIDICRLRLLLVNVWVDTIMF